MSYEAELAGHYAGVRLRLRSPMAPMPPPRVSPLQLTAPKYVAPPPPPAPEVEVAEDDEVAITSRDILRQVARKHNVTVPMMIGASRRANISSARREAAGRMHMELGMSLAQIGRRMRRDHTTILHMIRVESLTNDNLREAYGFRQKERDIIGQECIRLRSEGVGTTEICRRLGVSKGKVEYALRYKSFPQAEHGGN